MISSGHTSSFGDNARLTESSESPPPLVLEICSGRTRFPFRPVTSNRFLIGAAEGCDLRLGGDDMPPLHSIIHLDHVEALLETITLTPPLKVNGLVVESVLLQDGDRVRIGPFELLAHRPTTVTNRLPDEMPSANAVIAIDDNAVKQPALSELSASELADLIEEEELRVAHFEQRRRLGENALLDAVAERIDLTAGDLAETSDAAADTTVGDDRPAIAAVALEATGESREELVRLLEQANSLAAELERRTERLVDREAAQIQLTEAVFDSQQKLAIRLESLVARISDLEERRLSRYPRVA
jgi:hypothetical protein